MFGLNKKRGLIILSITLFISIFSMGVNATDNSMILIQKIQSPEMTFPLIIFLIIIILTIIILYLKRYMENKNKPSSEYMEKKTETQEKELIPKDDKKVNLKLKQKKFKKGKFKKEIVNYIILASKKGLDDKKIRDNLLNAGWKKEDIERTFEEINNL